MKRNIWIINHYATEMFRTGGGRHYWFAKELIKQGYNPIIICSNVYLTSTEQSVDVGKNGWKLFINDGVRYVMINTSIYQRNDLKRVRNMVDFYVGLRRYANKIMKIVKPDIIIGSSVHPLTCVAGIQIAKKYKIPVISEIRDLWPQELVDAGGIRENGLLAKLLYGLEHWIYKKSNAMVFTMEGAAQYIRDRKWDIENGGDIDLAKAHYINNGVCLEEFDKNLSEIHIEDPDLTDDSFRITYTGSIRKTNGIERLLDLGEKLKTIPDIRIMIYGDGDQVDALKKRIANDHLTNVYYKGRVDKKYIPYILSRSSLNILNYLSGDSFRYGCSNNKLFEYLAAGKPILCTVKMNYSIIGHYDCGTEVETDEEIEREVLRIYRGGRELQERLARNTRKAAEDFDFVRHTQALIEVINTLI